VNPYLYQLENLPTGLISVLGAPFPWTVRRLKDLPTVPEMLAWYAMLALAAVGIVATFKRDWRKLLLPLLFSAGLILVLALVEGNVGTIFRHRSMLMPTTFIAAGIGLTWLLERRNRQSKHAKAGMSS
jgi:predicted exporter